MKNIKSRGLPKFAYQQKNIDYFKQSYWNTIRQINIFKFLVNCIYITD